MKAAIFREEDKCGIMTGHLSAPDRVSYEDNGKVGHFQLTGKVIDTEKYDVVIIGRETEEGVLEVHRMESIPDEKNPVEFFGMNTEKGKLRVLAFHKSLIVESNDRTTENGGFYKSMKINLPKGYCYLNVWNYRNPDTDAYIILLDNWKEEQNIYGTGFGKKTVTTFYAAGKQLLS